MALSHSQLEELSLLQDKYINKEITKNSYEHEKNKILNSGKQNTHFGEEDFSDLSTSNNNSNMEGLDFINILALIFSGIFTFFGFLFSIFPYLHKKIVYIAEKKKIELWIIYGIFGIIFCSLLIEYIAYTNHTASIKQIEQQDIIEKQIAEERKNQEIRDEKIREIAREKESTPHPEITLLSPIGNQGNESEGYTIRVSATGADAVYLYNGPNTFYELSLNGSGVYEKTIWISALQPTTIKLTAKNKYFSDSKEYVVSREKTDDEIQEEKKMEEETKEAERKAERKKKQQLEDEKKTYTSISYAKLKKSTDSYSGKRIKFSGKIFTANENNGTTTFQINTDSDGYDNQIVVVANWQNDYVEGNWVTVWGEVVDEFCYTSQAGWNICVPRVKANIIE